MNESVPVRARVRQLRHCIQGTFAILAPSPQTPFEGIAKRLDPNANTIVEVARYLAPHIGERRRLARGTRDWIETPVRT